jgi:cytochrome c oxidase subunit 1
MMNESLGRIHFVGSLICMNVIFMPMFVQGLAGVNRRLWDGGTLYTHAQGTLSLNVPMSYAAFALAFFQLFFIVNLVWSIRGGRPAGDNPWEATTLEWSAPTPPLAHGNFDRPLRVVRDPYEYSPPGTTAGFLPQAASAEERT